MSANHPEGHVTMTVPNGYIHLRLIRLVVASLASDLGFGYDEVEDLRIVVDEVAQLVMESSLPSSPVVVDVVAKGTELRVVVVANALELDTAPALDVLAAEIVRSLVPVHEVVFSDGKIEASFESYAPAMHRRNESGSSNESELPRNG